jgi:DNA-binding LytR/AlgR family response regulator
MSKILVIEDDSQVRQSIVEILKSADFKVFEASDGNAGIGLAMELVPDLILCDVMMPHLDGYGVIEKITSCDELKKIPFIFLTAKAELGDIREGMNLGADDYITKPFKAHDLINSIQVRLNRLDGFKNSIEQTDEIDSDHFNKFSYDQKIFISEGKNPQFIRVSDIVAITADSDYTNVFLRDKSKIYLRRLLLEWNKMLPENKFFRIHRSTIINLDYVEKVEKWFKRSYKIFMKDINESFIVSERSASLLRKELGM